MRIQIRDPESFWPWIRDGKIRIRKKHLGSATLCLPMWRKIIFEKTARNCFLPTGITKIGYEYIFQTSATSDIMNFFAIRNLKNATMITPFLKRDQERHHGDRLPWKQKAVITQPNYTSTKAVWKLSLIKLPVSDFLRSSFALTKKLARTAREPKIRPNSCLKQTKIIDKNILVPIEISLRNFFFEVREIKFVFF